MERRGLTQLVFLHLSPWYVLVGITAVAADDVCEGVEEPGSADSCASSLLVSSTVSETLVRI